MNILNELLPCPFCNGEADYTDNYNGNGTGHCVYCTDCGCGTAILTGATPPEDLKVRVYALWNKRVRNELQEQIASVKRSVKSENSDYLTGYIAALSAVEGMITETKKG